MNSNDATTPIPQDNPSPTTIIIWVRSQDGDIYVCLMSRSAKLREMFKMYCEKRHTPYDAVTFLHDGKRVDPAMTPDELGLDDFDEIDAMMQQTGGGGGGGGGGGCSF